MQIAKQIRTHFAKVIRVCQSALQREKKRRRGGGVGKRKRAERGQVELIPFLRLSLLINLTCSKHGELLLLLFLLLLLPVLLLLLLWSLKNSLL